MPPPTCSCFCFFQFTVFILNIFLSLFFSLFLFGGQQEITNQEENTFVDARQGTQVQDAATCNKCVPQKRQFTKQTKLDEDLLIAIFVCEVGHFRNNAGPHQLQPAAGPLTTSPIVEICKTHLNASKCAHAQLPRTGVARIQIRKPILWCQFLRCSNLLSELKVGYLATSRSQGSCFFLARQ